MKKFFKALAVLVLVIHVIAGLMYIGIIPLKLFTNLRMPEAGRLAEFIMRLNENSEEEEVLLSAAQSEEQTDAAEAAAGEDTSHTEEAALSEDVEAVQIELSGELPELMEEDLYDLPRVLINAGSLKATGAGGEDLSDQVICELAADITHPGHFTAVFSIQAEDGQIERGPSADMQIELTSPFLAFREDDLTVPAGTDYDPYRNILICMDIDGTVLTEFVEYEGYFDSSQAGDYELRFFIYSRVNTSSTFRTMRIHVDRT